MTASILHQDGQDFVGADTHVVGSSSLKYYRWWAIQYMRASVHRQGMGRSHNQAEKLVSRQYFSYDPTTPEGLNMTLATLGGNGFRDLQKVTIAIASGNGNFPLLLLSCIWTMSHTAITSIEHLLLGYRALVRGE